MFEELKSYEFIVLAPEHYNTLGLIRSLGEAGVKPIYVSIKSRYKIASYSRYIKKIYNVDSIEEGYQLISSLDLKGKKAFLYTIDDKTQAYLDSLPDIPQRFSCFNCQQPGRTIRFMDKKIILDAANSCDIPTLGTYLVPRGTIPENLEYPVITKSSSPISGGWKSDVHICYNKQELLDAFKVIKSDQVLLQKYIVKQNECCLDGFVVNHGKDLFIATETYYNYNIPGYYSPYMTSKTFNPNDFKIAYKKLQNLFKLIGFEGIFSMEFLVDESGEMYFSEINFRHSTWSYIATKNKMNLPIYWAMSMLDNKVVCQAYDIKKNYTSMVEPVDYLKRVVERKYSRFKWLKDLITTNCKFYWNWKDLKPGIHMLLHNKEFR